MQHILEIIGSGTPGGGTTAVLELASGLRNAGHPVTLATARHSYLISEARQRGLQTLALDFKNRSSSPKLAHILKSYIIETGVTLVHAHGARAALPVSLMKLTVPSVYTVHGFHYPSKPPGIRHLARHVEKLCIRHADATVFVSMSDQRLAKSERLADGAAQSVIYNGVTLPSLLVDAEPSKTFDIAFLGRLHPQKNPLLLVDILQAMRPLRPRLAIIGGGALEVELRDRLTAAGLLDQVTFCGEQAHLSGLQLLRQARVMLLPSLFEGLPLAVIESMHLGVPVVACAVGGIPELISHGVSGLLADRGDAQGLGAALCTLLSNERLRSSMAMQAQQHAQSLFTAERNLQGHLDLYHQVLRTRSQLENGLAA